MAVSNFSFLAKKWPVLANLGEMAERNLHQDPNTTLIKLRMFAEMVVKYILAYEKLPDSPDNSQVARLRLLKQEDLLQEEMLQIFHTIRVTGNRATHEAYGSQQEAATMLSLTYRLGVWFMQVYGAWDFKPAEFVLPPAPATAIPVIDLQQQLTELTQNYEAHLASLQDELERLSHQQTLTETAQARRNQSRRVASQLKLTEAETRKIIDEQLRAAGWNADTENLRYPSGARPEKGKNLAISEWPAGQGWADYALFTGMTLMGLVEAKRKGKDVISDLEQAKKYARNITRQGEEQWAGAPWGDYKVPFLFATNGRPYLKQIETKSGIWFLDAHRSNNHPRVLQAWYTPKGMQDLLKQNPEVSHVLLKREPFDYLNLRDYQNKAIRAVEKAIEKDQREILVAMATGTGKTRTTVGLVYRLIKSRRFRRVLFLVDRTALGEQAHDTFKEATLEDLLNFTQIYDVKGLSDRRPELDTKVHIATIQGMIKRIMFSDNGQDKPAVDWYDCIVVDEAHRGYLLDKEMGEAEFLFRDQKDYISKYRQVLEYFDAVRIGLTATPAIHTREIFGHPVYTYSYREAVIDGWLVDHEPPHQLETKLKRQGIKWQKGEVVPIYDPVTGQITNSDELPDELSFEVDKFNKVVITENFNRTVLKKIVEHLDPTDLEKTLIFAATDDHADMVVKLLKEEFEAAGVEVDDDAIVKITASIKDPLGTFRKFKNERLPNIAVTVDLLTTGVDVPEICNIVFLRRVRSRILYEQMLGRATRLCDKIKKSHFNIFDAVGLYEVLEPVTNMKPVVVNPKVSLTTMLEESQDIDDPALLQQHIEAIIAKIQRKRRRLDQEELERFADISGGQSIQDFIHWLRRTPAGEVKTELPNKRKIFSFLDEDLYKQSKKILSFHDDELLSHTRGYGKGEKPQDYLEEFGKFIRENINKLPALQIVVQRPRELTRQALRELKIELDRYGYSEVALNTAWCELKNEDIAADIIGFIRQQVLGDALISHEERIKKAMKKVKGLRQWTKVQMGWLDRVELQLFKETVVDRASFDRDPFIGQGGFERINKIFGGQLEEVIKQINDSLYNGRSSA